MLTKNGLQNSIIINTSQMRLFNILFYLQRETGSLTSRLSTADF